MESEAPESANGVSGGGGKGEAVLWGGVYMPSWVSGTAFSLGEGTDRREDGDRERLGA